ncbi:RICIN domain-containing protein [Streptomyces sp. NPDC056431]|uniref:RICIN domain-containing protein n=1 Tax=Streptomyces sp. NPDC056431 TaxID=3345814 RepID=UPI00368F5CBE
MTLQDGEIFSIVNAKSGTVMDLSATDGHSVIGWTHHGGENQQWRALQRDNHWFFKNVDTGLYLGVADHPMINSTPVVGVHEAFAWDVFPDEEDQSAHRLYVPGNSSAMNVELSDHGNDADGTPVQLWGNWRGENQRWRFKAV